MDLIHQFLNLVAPPFTFFTLLFSLPPFQFFRFFLSFVGSIFTEDVAGKVVLITGASSGIGKKPAGSSRKGTGSWCPGCFGGSHGCFKGGGLQKCCDRTMNHFGRLDHLVNNAGMMSICMLEEDKDVTDFRTVIVRSKDTNFWGYVYMTQFAVPHLRNSRGRIAALSSSASWLPAPRMGFYNASKAAIAQFFETLRIEFGPDIGITLVTPGFIESELTQGKHMSKEGKLEVDQDIRDVTHALVSIIPVQRVESCARGIVSSACKGERYVTEPAWFRATFLWRIFCPEVIEWTYRLLYITRPGESPKDTIGKKLVDFILYPETIQVPEKTD